LKALPTIVMALPALLKVSEPRARDAADWIRRKKRTRIEVQGANVPTVPAAWSGSPK